MIVSVFSVVVDDQAPRGVALIATTTAAAESTTTEEAWAERLRIVFAEGIIVFSNEGAEEES